MVCPSVCLSRILTVTHQELGERNILRRVSSIISGNAEFSGSAVVFTENASGPDREVGLTSVCASVCGAEQYILVSLNTSGPVQRYRLYV